MSLPNATPTTLRRPSVFRPSDESAGVDLISYLFFASLIATTFLF